MFLRAIYRALTSKYEPPVPELSETYQTWVREEAVVSSWPELMQNTGTVCPVEAAIKALSPTLLAKNTTAHLVYQLETKL